MLLVTAIHHPINLLNTIGYVSQTWPAYMNDLFVDSYLYLTMPRFLQNDCNHPSVRCLVQPYCLIGVADRLLPSLKSSIHYLPYTAIRSNGFPSIPQPAIRVLKHGLIPFGS